jgi:integrase
MEQLAGRYLAHRRALGYRLVTDGYALVAFARFADRTAPRRPLTIAIALEWASRRPAMAVTIANRLSMIRGFARYCSALDPRTQVPPFRLTHCIGRRRAPHIFTDEQVRLLMRRTSGLEAWRTPLRPVTYRTLIGLLACTGIRTCEALRLRDGDFDGRAGNLHIPATKRGPGRVLPLHQSTVRALRRYQALRRARFPFTHAFFTGPWGRPLSGCAAQWTFRRLVLGIASNGIRPTLRLYDFRHTFATKLIARWSRQRAPLAHRLLLLSRYLGHKYFHHTYWYVQRQPTALATAASRFEHFHKQPPPA